MVHYNMNILYDFFRSNLHTLSFVIYFDKLSRNGTFNDILQRCNRSYVDVIRQFVRTIKLSFVIVSPLTLSEISTIIYSIQRFIHNNV